MAERGEAVEQFRKSGLTEADFAAENGLTLWTLTRGFRESAAWDRKNHPESKGAGVQFHSLAFPSTAGWSAEVQQPDGTGP